MKIEQVELILFSASSSHGCQWSWITKRALAMTWELTQPWPEMTQPAAQWGHSVNPDTGRWWPCSSSLALRCIYNLRAMMCAIMCGHNPYAITCGIKCHGWSSNGPSSIDLIFECTWCLLRMNGFWFNGKSIAQHERGKGALNPLLLPIFAITGVLPGHKWNTTQYRQNTMQYTSEIQLPLINAASLSSVSKKCISVRAWRRKNFLHSTPLLSP